MTGLLLLLAAGALLAISLVTLFTILRLRRPPRRTYASALHAGVPGDPSELDRPRPFSTTTFTPTAAPPPSNRHAFPLWDIQGDDPDGPVMLSTPGWGDSRLGVLPRLGALAPIASAILIWDPPGAGEAPAHSLLGTREHLILADLVQQLEREGRLGNGLILHGWSLGGGVAIALAAHLRDHPNLRAVIAEAPYRLAPTPARNVMRLAGFPHRINTPLAFLYLGARLAVGPKWKGFDRAHHAAQIPCPLLVIHGDADEICPIEDGRAIADAAPHGRLVSIEGAAHNDVWAEPRFAQAATEAIHDFVRRSALARQG